MIFFKLNDIILSTFVLLSSLTAITMIDKLCVVWTTHKAFKDIKVPSRLWCVVHTMHSRGLSVVVIALKVGLGIFDFCAISRRLISKDLISSPNFSWGFSYAEHALWCQDSKRWALGNYFSMRICYGFPMSKCRGDWDLGLCTFWVLVVINPQNNVKIRLFLRTKRVVSGSRFYSTVLLS